MSTDLLSFFPAQALKHIGGSEHAGACPYCGGEDRFRLWLDRGPRERSFWCRQCQKSGDAIELVRHLEQCSYRDACRLLDIDPGTPKSSRAASSPSSSRPSSSSSSSAKAPKKDTETMPSETWRTAAAAWLAECQQHLRTSREAWQALADRYLSVESALAAGIGWNPRTEYVPRSAWGLPVGPGKDKIILPKGLVLSARRSCGVVGLTVKLYGSGEGPRFRDIAGGAALPFALGRKGLPVLICESVLDAVLIWQEAQGKLAVVACFGTSKTFDAPCVQFIQQAPVLFLNPDRDKPGIEALVEWKRLFPQGRQVFVPGGYGAKDAGELQAKAYESPPDAGIPSVYCWLHRHILAHICPENDETAKDDVRPVPNKEEAA